MLDSSYQHAELVVSEDAGAGDAQKGSVPSELSGAAATAVDGNTEQTSKDEVEPLVITTVSSNEKQANVDVAGDESAREKASLMLKPETTSASADDGSARMPVSTSENGGAEDHTESETPVSLENSGVNAATASEGHGPQGEQEHLPEPPASPVSNTVASSISTGTTNAEGASVPPPATKAPSANRLSISYASGTRRLLIDADIVEKMTVMRSEGRIEVAMTVERLADGYKGILVRYFSFFAPFFHSHGIKFTCAD